jgi:hypothetical protein
MYHLVEGSPDQNACEGKHFLRMFELRLVVFLVCVSLELRADSTKKNVASSPHNENLPVLLMLANGLLSNIPVLRSISSTNG